MATERPEAERIVFRIGLHVGDVIIDGDDLYGDGVNIAARLEARAPAGGILVSRTVHEAVAGRLNATFDDLGDLALKKRFDPASSWAAESLRRMPSFLMVVGIVAAGHALAGRTDEAQRAIIHLRQLDPTLRVSNLADWLPIRRPKDLATFADGLRRVGLE